MENNTLTLYELNTLIKEVISFSFSDIYLVKAEIAKITENVSGHCYLELVEKAAQSDTIIAQTKAMIWRNQYWRIQSYFNSVTGKDLAVGMNIMFKAKIEFHQLYGFSLHIVDIDPNYTLGEMMAQKRKIIAMLKNEGIFDLNRMLNLPLVPQRIAVISSPTAVGYTDFMTHIVQNSSRYKFYITLFKATMQGEKSEQSIISALEKIYSKSSSFDVVVIIRGGGSQVDLSCYDSYLLAAHVAQFPLPIITGIGHEQDETIVDMVAHTQLKTPTAVAEFLIQKLHHFMLSLYEYHQQIIDYSTKVLANEKENLTFISQQIPKVVNHILSIHQNYLQIKHVKCQQNAVTFLLHEKQKLGYKLLQGRYSFLNQINNFHKNLELSIQQLNQKSFEFIHQQHAQLTQYHTYAQLSDPIHILKKGYSITWHNNQPLIDATTVNINDSIVTKLYNGCIMSSVLKKIN